MFLISPVMFGVVWNHYGLKLHGKPYKTEIKILANPGLA